MKILIIGNYHQFSCVPVQLCIGVPANPRQLAASTNSISDEAKCRDKDCKKLTYGCVLMRAFEDFEKPSS